VKTSADITVLNSASDKTAATSASRALNAGLPAGPDLSQGYLPPRSSSVFSQGTLLDYLPVKASCKGNQCSSTLRSGGLTLGIIDPAGHEHDSLEYTVYYGQLIGTWMLDPTSSAALGSVLIEEDYWELQWSVTVPANSPFETDQAVTSGITETDTTAFSYTIGASISGFGFGLSGSLTRSLQHAVAITSQQTTTYKFQWPQQPVERTVGVYQLMQAFSVQPGRNIMAVLTEANARLGKCGGQDGDFCLKIETGSSFVYPTPTFLQVVAVPPPPSIDINEVKAIVKGSMLIS
jgi:hypothetical protein